MVIGLFLRNYKCYKGVHFLPFTNDKHENLNVFIGNNGAGKSSVLEALDTFFNNRDWIIHHESKRNDVFVAPLFLYTKARAEEVFKKSSKEIESISDAIWNVSINSNSNYKKYSSFFELRDNILSLKESHYLFVFSKNYDNSANFSPFDSPVKEKLKLDEISFSQHINNRLKEEFFDAVKYLYIPVETSITEFLRLETKELQDLMNVDIKKNIANALADKKIGRTNGTKRIKKLSLLDIINENLEDFINNIESTIQTIDSEYNFSKEYKSKGRLTANHITSVIIEAYFSKRRLKKSKKPIQNLSAGERKRALMDIAFTFLNHSKNKRFDEDAEKEVILAIDEPESSLHISQCYEQFNKINVLTNSLGVQVLITTHWYGSLPIFRKGILSHIGNKSDKPVVKLFSLENYFEQRGDHPDDIHLKSFYDLSSSILSSTKLYNTNWVLVEGSEDKKYLEYFLEDKDIKILPLGGCSIVKMIYEYLYLPISQKSENKSVEGKVFCLIDTDTNGIQLNLPQESKVDNNLLIRRLQFDENSKKIILKKVNDGYRSSTEIEESLNPKQFYEALGSAIELYAEQDVKEAFDSFDFDKDVNTSFIKGDYSILNHKGGKKENGEVRNLRTDKEIITDFIDSHKGIIAEEYVKMTVIGVPEWINEIRDFFSVDKKMKLFKTIV